MNKITTRTLPGFLNERGIGFDRMFDLFDEAVGYAGQTTYPPYNVLKIDEDAFAIEIAVAGFDTDSIEITQNGNKLNVTGQKAEVDDEGITYIHRGISARSFDRDFLLAEHVKVDDADFENGILTIRLHRELPEEMKPRSIDIKRVGK